MEERSRRTSAHHPLPLSPWASLSRGAHRKVYHGNRTEIARAHAPRICMRTAHNRSMPTGRSSAAHAQSGGGDCTPRHGSAPTISPPRPRHPAPLPQKKDTYSHAKARTNSLPTSAMRSSQRRSKMRTSLSVRGLRAKGATAKAPAVEARTVLSSFSKLPESEQTRCDRTP
eukprot:4166676-Pleurochrysis_carterae.AAC.1